MNGMCRMGKKCKKRQPVRRPQGNARPASQARGTPLALAGASGVGCRGGLAMRKSRRRRAAGALEERCGRAVAPKKAERSRERSAFCDYFSCLSLQTSLSGHSPHFGLLAVQTSLPKFTKRWQKSLDLSGGRISLSCNSTL